MKRCMLLIKKNQKQTKTETQKASVWLLVRVMNLDVCFKSAQLVIKIMDGLSQY